MYPASINQTKLEECGADLFLKEYERGGDVVAASAANKTAQNGEEYRISQNRIDSPNEIAKMKPGVDVFSKTHLFLLSSRAPTNPNFYTKRLQM